MRNELIIPQDLNPTVIFSKPEKVDAILQQIEEAVKNFTSDISTPQGRDAIKSMAYKISRSKTTLDEMGKGLVLDWKAQAKLVDNERSRIRGRLDELKEQVRQPLTDFENAEKERIQIRQDRICEIESLCNFAGDDFHHSQFYKDTIVEVNFLKEFDWQEFDFKAKSTANECLELLNKRIKIALGREAEQVELEKHRKEKAERVQKEREERIAQEATERAKKEAEEMAELEKRKSEEREKRIQEEKADAEKRAAESERLRVEQEEAAERCRIEAEAKAKEFAKIAAEKAAKCERLRIEGEKQAEEKAKSEIDRLADDKFSLSAKVKNAGTSWSDHGKLEIYNPEQAMQDAIAALHTKEGDYVSRRDEATRILEDAINQIK